MFLLKHLFYFLRYPCSRARPFIYIKLIVQQVFLAFKIAIGPLVRLLTIVLL